MAYQQQQQPQPQSQPQPLHHLQPPNLSPPSLSFQPQAPQASPTPQPASGLSQQYGYSAMAAMPPPQRPYHQLSNTLTGPPAIPSTNSPPGAQHPSNPPPIPTSSMTAVAPVSSAQSTPTSNTSSKPTTPKASPLPPLDQGRVAALLHLNVIILRELQYLQSTGANNQPGQSTSQKSNPPGAQASTTTPSSEAQKSPTGASSTTPTTAAPTAPALKAIKPPPKYIFDNYLKRLQVNIAYLLALSQGKPVPPHPLAMEPPPDSWSQIEKADATDAEKAELDEKGKKTAEELREAYAKLKELWPNYRPGVRPNPPAGQGLQLQQAQGAQGHASVQPLGYQQIQHQHQHQHQQYQQQQQ
ncbi:MAG: hypothetical protein Q9163_006256 [Psora crenata]